VDEKQKILKLIETILEQKGRIRMEEEDFVRILKKIRRILLSEDDNA